MTQDLSLQLRLAAPADAPMIRNLTREAYAPWVAVIGREPLPMGADYEAALRAHRFDLAYRAGAPVALIETRAEADHLLVVNIAVASAWQGQGIGRFLLAHAETLARGLGLTTLRLYTMPPSPGTSPSTGASATASSARRRGRWAGSPCT